MKKVIMRERETGSMAYLPAYASYLLDNRLTDFQVRNFELFDELGVPLLRNIEHNEAQALVHQSTHDLLVALSSNLVERHIQKVIIAFKTNQLPQIDSESLVADDITLMVHARKRAFLEFISDFSANVHDVIKLVEEIENYTHEYISAAFKALAELSDQRVNEQLRRLEESERQSAQAQALTHLGNFTWDLVQNRMTWSDEMYRIYGLAPIADGIPYDVVASFNHPEDSEYVQRIIWNSRKTGESFDFYYRIILQDGKIKTLHVQGEVMADQLGISRTIFGTAQDVTERQNLLDQLRENEQLYRQIESIAHVGGWYWKVGENVVIWTDELCRIYGIEPHSEDINFEKYIDFVYPDDREMVIRTVQDALNNGSPYTFHHRIIARDGRVKVLYAQGQVVTDSQGRVVQMMGSAQDVTEQKKAEARLLENQNFIKKVANSTPAIISTFEVDSGRYTFMNLGLEKNLNYTLQEVMSRGVSFFSELVHPDDAAELVNRHQEILLEANQLEAGNEEEVFDYRYRLKHQNGQYRWLHTFGTVFERTRSNHVKQILNISLDITERIEAEQVLLQRTRELQQSNASLEEFAYITSHDLKEPLRKISLFVERLAALRTSCTEEEGLYYEKILDASERMRQMIDDILSLSLVSKKWKMERVDLQKVMDEVLCALDEEIRMKGAVVEVDDLPVMQAITPQIGQLFHNLISNSLKFCRPEVSPCIHIRHNVLMPSEVRSPVTPASRYIQIVFSDNGIGFDNNFQEKIFAVFQRLHHRHQYEGTGIGLAICKKIVTNHGGAITASGRIGEGAEFSVILPM